MEEKALGRWLRRGKVKESMEKMVGRLQRPSRLRLMKKVTT